MFFPSAEYTDIYNKENIGISSNIQENVGGSLKTWEVFKNIGDLRCLGNFTAYNDLDTILNLNLY